MQRITLKFVVEDLSMTEHITMHVVFLHDFLVILKRIYKKLINACILRTAYTGVSSIFVDPLAPAPSIAVI